MEGWDSRHNWRLSCTIMQIYNEPSTGMASVILVTLTQKDFFKKIGDPEPDGKSGQRHGDVWREMGILNWKKLERAGVFFREDQHRGTLWIPN